MRCERRPIRLRAVVAISHDVSQHPFACLAVMAPVKMSCLDSSGGFVFSTSPIPGNPWPHDMSITIENDSQTLLELLWIREAWRMQPVGEDLPPRLVDTPSLVDDLKRSSVPIEQWQHSWPDMWEACLRHAGTPRDPSVFDRLHRSEIGSDERDQLLRDLFGPSWRDSFGAEALTDDEQQWSQLESRRIVDRDHLMSSPSGSRSMP